MSDISILRTAAPYHIISYGTLLGTEFFQTFIGGIVSYKALARPQFSQLQQKLFPVYFGIQTTLPVVLALTYPASKLGLGTSSGFRGVLADVNKWSVLVPIATIFVTSLVNMAVVGPATTKVMRERKHQETRDGKKYYDPAPHSEEMQKMNKDFSIMHGISSLLNLVGFISTCWYGVSIAGRIQ
ncbi:hypothetical protein WAI453_001567 [Rhynchosporium graminicola]|uniref:TMEM205-like domain-containing protein n=2 Tax=Rhynchosporium TaxID=38037 RepID=A0A1E1MN21_RHYSE|nr:uncharacterized protein RCO7_08739 [Rhynchosporium commune]CZT50484.1 uncharacterized protein RSE6_11481 [Rhynchosporium secalis]